MGKRIGFSLVIGILLLLLYLLFWPVPIHPSEWTPPELPPLTGVYQENNYLAAIERLARGMGTGPEDIAFDSQGFLYTGLEDERGNESASARLRERACTEIMFIADHAGSPELRETFLSRADVRLVVGA